MGSWTLNHVVANCQACGWAKGYHGVDQYDHDYVLRSARRHSDKHGHYVQVERGQHMHYGLAGEGEPHTSEGETGG